MTGQQIIDYLISTLVGTKVLVDHDSDATKFIDKALELFDEDTINQATMATVVVKNTDNACILLKQAFIEGVTSRHPEITGHRAFDGGAWKWVIQKEGGKIEFLNTDELGEL